jgi:Dolichyl-phosphate-mannose-protein mannosyltransferase/C-terminal four TMM region of protein-O-mannosyltransferase
LAGSSLRGVSPRGRASAVYLNADTAFAAIVALLALGLILRLIIAYGLLPGSGFPNDLGAFQAWGNDIASNGPVGFYDRQSFIDYPPVYLLMLGVVSLISGGNLGEAVKLVPIMSDLVLAVVVGIMVRELGASRLRAVVVAAVVLLNPITWFNSAIWGQADAVGSIFLLLGLRELMKDRREAAAALAVVSVLTKMQLGILGFLVGFVILRRSLAPREGPAQPERIFTSIGAGLLTGAVICLPFTGLDFGGFVTRLGTVSGALTIAAGVVAGLGVFALALRYLRLRDESLRLPVAAVLGAATVVAFGAMVFDSIASHLLNTFGEYPYLTLNAYNPWALLQSANGSAMATTHAWLRDAPFTDPQSGPQAWYGIGPLSGMGLLTALLLLLALIFGAAAAWRGATRIGESAVAPGWLRGRDLRLELRSLAAAFAVGAVVLAVVMAAVSIFAPVPAVYVGDGLLLLVLVGASAWAAWRDDSLTFLVALTIMSIAFFVVPTRVHERYLFPFFGLAAVLFAFSWRWRIAYVALAVVNSMNLLAVLVQYNGIPGGDGGIGGLVTDWGNFLFAAQWPEGLVWPIAASAVVSGLVMVWALLQMRGTAAARLARETEAAVEPQGLEGEPQESVWDRLFGSPEREGRPVQGATPRPSIPAGAGGGVAAVGAADLLASSADTSYRAAGQSSDEPSELVPEPELDLTYPEGELEADWGYEDEGVVEEEPVYVPRSVMRLWRRLARPSVYPDRSASLTNEPRGRIDKLDIWIVVALVIGVLCMRVYRLGEPTQMYFDEVYHARTATEFLQEWKYGIPHDIYEWTHPHLAKYAIAGGITLFSDDKVTGTGKIDGPVLDVYVQPRTPTSPDAAQDQTDLLGNSGNRYGDRVFVATGSAVEVYDLQTRALVYTYQIPGASAISTAGATGVIYVGTTDGHIWRLDSSSLDQVRMGALAAPTAAAELPVDTGLTIAHLYAGTPPFILAADANGKVVSVDVSQAGGTVVGSATVPGAADFADLGLGPTTVNVLRSQVTDPAAEASVLAAAVNGNAADLESAIGSAEPNIEVPLPVGSISGDKINAIQSQITLGNLPGITISAARPQVMVAYQSGIGTLDARDLTMTATIPTTAPATSIAINPDADQDSYVAAGDSIVLIKVNVTGDAGSVSKDGNQPLRKMPGTITKVMFDSATKVAQALGRTQDGTGWTVYAIETNGDAVFSDAPLPFEPAAIGLDSSPQLPGTNREQVLAFSSDGSMATVDVGQFAFSWRIVGVLFGALLAACLYLLVRILFKRRTVGLLVAAFSLMDGMLFAQSRIAMNDTYVGGFLLLAYLLFALIWLNVWKGRLAFWLGMPVLGVILGLALASKWVALYAIASIGILILIRSALGRVITILGLAAGTGVLGWQAIAEMRTQPDTGNPAVVISLTMLAIVILVGGAFWAASQRTTPDKVFAGGATGLLTALLFGAALTFSPGSIDNGAPNYTYFIIMLVITVLAAAGNAYRPVAWTREETLFATVGPVVAGVVLALFGFALAHGFLGGYLSGFITAQGSRCELAGVGLVGLGVGAGVAFWLAGYLGFGPFAPAPGEHDRARFAEPPSPAPSGWLRLGHGYGLHALWMMGCVMVLPIVVYILLYIPWSMPWQPQTSMAQQYPAIACWHTSLQADGSTVCTDAWPAGHTGQNLWELTISMYNYHNNLRASHAASSPWWAWPMDLKPVWFESIGYANDNGSMIYDGGNPVLWWLAIAAMGFICWQAFKRRSLGLALIAVAFFWQWISWSRIDRAAFQYHFYTSLPFFLAALAYFLAELWHGPSRRTWLFARLAAVGACLFPAIMWVLKPELCGLARVDTSQYFQNTVCGTGTGDVVITTKILLISIALVVALGVLALILWRLERRQEEGYEDPNWMLQLLVPVGLAGALLWWLGQNAPNSTFFQAALPSDYLAIVFAVVGVLLAVVAVMATNPRRFVLGVVSAAAIAFAALYPNLSALPMPNAITGMYNALLPTWLYGFQFSVNLQESSPISLTTPLTATMSILALTVAVIAGWAAWERRVGVGYRRAKLLEAGAGQPAETFAAGADPSGEPTASTAGTGPSTAGADPPTASTAGSPSDSTSPPRRRTRKTSGAPPPPAAEE